MMQGSTGTSSTMWGILMGIETVDVLGRPLAIVLFVPCVCQKPCTCRHLTLSREIYSGRLYNSFSYSFTSEGRWLSSRHFCTPFPDSRIILIESGETWSSLWHRAKGWSPNASCSFVKHILTTSKLNGTSWSKRSLIKTAESDLDQKHLEYNAGVNVK